MSAHLHRRPYLFAGGLAAGSSLIAAGADLTGRPTLRRAGRLVLPERLDDLVDRHRGAVAQGQQGDDCPLFAGPEVDLAGIDYCVGGAEDFNLHNCRTQHVAPRSPVST